VLKLNGSNIHSLRDIGTSLKTLEALYISRCNLVELSGLVCFPKLQELYASFNSISDLKPISDAYHLTIIDIEGNDICEIK
jgi:Leucine-rich repeat (LRR) protein